MWNLPESTVNLLLSASMGLLGGLFAIPINAFFSWWLKRDEQIYQHKLDVIAKQRELMLQHKLMMERQKNDEIDKLKEIITKLEQRLYDV